MESDTKPDLIRLREAFEASWDSKTSYLGVLEDGNPALGQCYPTSWVVQSFLPKAEIVEGQVWTGKRLEKHFWNVLNLGGIFHHIDFTWEQFPSGSTVQGYKIRDRATLGDSDSTVARCILLRARVEKYLSGQS